MFCCLFSSVVVASERPLEATSVYVPVTVGVDYQDHWKEDGCNLRIKTYAHNLTGQIDIYFSLEGALPGDRYLFENGQIRFVGDPCISIAGNNDLVTNWVEEGDRPEHKAHLLEWFTLPISPLMNIRILNGYEKYFSRDVRPKRQLRIGPKIPAQYICQSALANKYRLTPEQVLHGVCALVAYHCFDVVYVPCIGCRFAPETIFPDELAQAMSEFLFAKKTPFSFSRVPRDLVKAQVSVMQRVAYIGYRPISIADVGVPALMNRVNRELWFWTTLGDREYSVEVNTKLFELIVTVDSYKTTFTRRSALSADWFEAVIYDATTYIISHSEGPLNAIDVVTETSASSISISSEEDE